MTANDLYFAYGSNLNITQMLQRCPGAVPLRKVELPNWRLVFRGVADIMPAKGHKVLGALYRITPACEKALDRYEGYPTLYTKKLVGTPRDEVGMFYIMVPGHAFAPPSTGYLNCILEGYADWEMDPESLLIDAEERV